MAIQDSVMIVDSTGIHISPDGANVTVYDLMKDDKGKAIVDSEGILVPVKVGGVKVTSRGRIVGDPVTVYKSKVMKMESAHYANEYVKLFPVHFEYYQKTAFVCEENLKIVTFQD